MAKREFLQLAHTYDPNKHWINGWYLSTKLDGIRAFYDGGITEGLYADEIPWANVEKDARLKNRPISTGLWSRYGKVIYAPKNWLDKLPRLFLDGELWMGNNSWQTLSSVVKKHVPDENDWNNVRFMALDIPNPHSIFADGIINNTNFKKTFNGISNWFQNNGYEASHLEGKLTFEFVYERLKSRLLENNNFKVHEQHVIPLKDSQRFVDSKLDEIVNQGGEGVVLRNPSSIWTPERTYNLLKYKPYHDDEATVVGWIWGRKTDLGSKLLGKMGALILNYKGQRFELSGFTDEEREINCLIEGSQDQIMVAGNLNEGEEINPHVFENRNFPFGSKVTFRYRELSDKGLPKEARYFRKHL